MLLFFGLVIAHGVHSQLLAVLTFFVVFPAYFAVGHRSASGQTLGKKACSIAVRRADDLSRLSYGRALWRFVIRLVLGFIPIIGLVNVLAPLWSARNQAWHDHGAATVVVRT